MSTAAQKQLICQIAHLQQIAHLYQIAYLHQIAHLHLPLGLQFQQPYRWWYTHIHLPILTATYRRRRRRRYKTYCFFFSFFVLSAIIFLIHRLKKVDYSDSDLMKVAAEEIRCDIEGWLANYYICVKQFEPFSFLSPLWICFSKAIQEKLAYFLEQTGFILCSAGKCVNKKGSQQLK